MFSEFTSTNGIPVTGFEISSSNTRCPDGVLPLPRDYQQTKDLKSPTRSSLFANLFTKRHLKLRFDCFETLHVEQEIILRFICYLSGCSAALKAFQSPFLPLTMKIRKGLLASPQFHPTRAIPKSRCFGISSS